MNPSVESLRRAFGSRIGPAMESCGQTIVFVEPDALVEVCQWLKDTPEEDYDYLVDVTPSSDMGFQDALILAMKKEKAAFRLYSDLAAVAADERIRDLFRALAQEEAKHKLRFELEYDDLMSEN